jgi:hypothetical protein
MMEAWREPVFGGLCGRACVNRRKAEKRADGGGLESGGAGCGAGRIGRQVRRKTWRAGDSGADRSKAQAKLHCSEKLLNRFPSGFRRKWTRGFRATLWSAMSRKRARFDFGWRENAPSDDFDRKLKHAIRPHPSKINPKSSSHIADLPPRNRLPALPKAGTRTVSDRPQWAGFDHTMESRRPGSGLCTQRDTCRENATG